jgi:hypothetical protein
MYLKKKKICPLLVENKRETAFIYLIALLNACKGSVCKNES